MTDDYYDYDDYSQLSSCGSTLRGDLAKIVIGLTTLAAAAVFTCTHQDLVKKEEDKLDYHLESRQGSIDSIERLANGGVCIHMDGTRYCNTGRNSDPRDNFALDDTRTIPALNAGMITFDVRNNLLHGILSPGCEYGLATQRSLSVADPYDRLQDITLNFCKK